MVAVGCSSSPAPASIPAPPPELAVLQLADKGYAIVEIRTGKVRAILPRGFLTIGLSGVGDIDEGYLVTSSAAQGTAIARLIPERSFALEPLATRDGVAAAAVLAPAPGLTSFVSPLTVLVVLTADGRLAGYQHGRLLWTDGGSMSRLLQVGDETLVLGALGWQRILVESGTLGPVEAGPTCLPGPLAVVAGRVVYDCGGWLSSGDVAVPTGSAAAFAAGGATVLAFPDGSLWQIDGSGARRTGKTGAWTVPPVSTPDGSLLYVATASGVERVATGSTSGHGLVKASGIRSVALSRDGNYLYTLSTSRLHTYAAATGSETGTVPSDGLTILDIAGG